MSAGRLRALFLGLGLVLLVGAGALGVEGDDPLLVNAGKAMGLVALALLLLQFTLSARLSLLDRAFGLDRLLRAHRVLGASAVVLAALHPLFIFGDPGETLGPLRAELWPELLGVATLVVLVAVACTSLWRMFLELPYERWRVIHLLTFVGTALAAVHALSVDEHLREGVRVVFLGLLLAGYVALYAWVRFVRPLRCRRVFQVDAVSPLSHDVTQLELSQTAGEPMAYQPGQFAFLRLGGEEHPFTLSSSPSRPGGIAFSIKASGDYTGALAATASGARADVMGPFGRFSYVHCGEGDLLLIAGGIGVTPLMSMIRHLADAGSERGVTLLWANRTEADIVFREELDRLAADLPGLRVEHVLSRQDDWAGEKGHIDAELLERVLTARDRAAHVFLCGPPAMMRSVRQALRRAGVRRARVHTETFAL